MSLGIASSGGGIDGLRKKSAKDGPWGSGRRCGSAVDFCLLRKRRRRARKRSSMVAEGLEARWPSAAFCDARRRRRSLRVKCVYFALLSARVSHRCEWQRLVMAKSSRQVDIQFCPSRTRPGTGPRTTVRTRRRGERQELKQQSPHAPPVPLFANALPSRRGERWRAETLTHGDVSCSAGSQRANRAALSR